jgi:hypothetical protein
MKEMHMNLQSIIDNSRLRDHAVADLSLAINELDLFALERILDHVASRIEALTPDVDPVTHTRLSRVQIAALNKTTPRTPAEAAAAADAWRALGATEKAVRARKRSKKLNGAAAKSP